MSRSALRLPLLALLLLGLITPTAWSEQTSDRSQQLDQLFEQLKNAPDEPTALRYEEAIWKHWTTTGDPAFDQPMSEIFRARNGREFDQALKMLHELGQQYPNNAEVWNQIATILYFKGDYEASLEAIAETLKREPRHFGSLAGRANIRLKQGKPTLGLQNIKEAMKIHPFLRERHWFPGLSDNAPAR